ncbi:NAD(P)H-binding protein [Nocardia sp. NPDC020380]|uniref:NAD(P)H-binding protein n=1 Tax=Nocardia sp. NPDC020380 TaxID=3364309 RepID=UPI0037B0A5C7
MIVITGANGLLGRMVVERLLERVPAGELGVSVRDPQQSGALEARGVRVRQGDFTDPASLATAFEGADQVLIVSSNSSGSAAVAQHRAAIDAAAAAGAGRIVYTSHMGANPNSPFPPMPDHAATEAALLDSGVPFTVLRNGFYAQSAVMLLGDAVETGELVAPEDGPVSWTAHADLADAAATLLTTPAPAAVTSPLTGPEALTMAEVADRAAELSGRPIRRIIVSDNDYRDALIGHGVPESAADLLVGLFQASRNGEFAPVSPTLADLLGRPTTTMAEYLKSALTQH